MQRESHGIGENSQGRYYCGHCDAVLSKTLFFRHKRLFYDRKAKRWSRRRVVDEVLVGTKLSEPFTLSSDSEEDTGEHHRSVYV